MSKASTRIRASTYRRWLTACVVAGEVRAGARRRRVRVPGRHRAQDEPLRAAQRRRYVPLAATRGQGTMRGPYYATEA